MESIMNKVKGLIAGHGPWVSALGLAALSALAYATGDAKCGTAFLMGALGSLGVHLKPENDG